jgi:MFS family permease
VVKKPYFYVVLLCMAFTGMALQGLDGISIPHMYDMGLEKEFVATLLTCSSLCLMGGKFLVGFMCDRKGARTVMNICLACSFLSLFGLVMISNTVLGRGIAYARMIFFAIAMPMETVMLPILTQELFGSKSFAKIVGLFSAATCLGFAFGAPFANLCYDLFESYNVSFIIFAGLMIFVTVALQFVFRSALRDRKIIEARTCEIESTVSEEKKRIYMNEVK